MANIIANSQLTKYGSSMVAVNSMVATPLASHGHTQHTHKSYIIVFTINVLGYYFTVVSYIHPYVRQKILLHFSIVFCITNCHLCSFIIYFIKNYVWGNFVNFSFFANYSKTIHCVYVITLLCWLEICCAVECHYTCKNT